MKKLISVFVTVILLLSLTACVGEGGKVTASPDASLAATASANPDTPTPLKETATPVVLPPAIVDIRYGGVEAWNIRAEKEFQILIIADEKTTAVKAFEKGAASRGSELSGADSFVDVGEGKRGFEISLLMNTPGDFEIVVVPIGEAGEGAEQAIPFTVKTNPQITAPGIVYTISPSLEGNYMPDGSDLETPDFFGARYRADNTAVHIAACKVSSSRYAGFQDSVAAFIEGFERSEVTVAGATAEKYAGLYKQGEYYAEMIIFTIDGWTYTMSYDTGDRKENPYMTDYETLVQSVVVAG